MKKIAINTRLLIPGKMDGIGWFTFEIFSRIAKNNPQHRFYYFFDRKFSDEFITSDNIIPVVVSPQARHPFLFYLWFEFAVPWWLKKIKADIFVSPDSFNITKKNVPSLMVIHDLNFEHNPEFLPKLISWYYRRYTPKMANTAQRIATVSEFSKNDICKHYNIEAQKIDVVYNGANTMFTPVSEEEQQIWRDNNTQGKPFFIFVGTIHPRKNLENQLLAFDIFRNNNENLSHKFVIVGEKWGRNDNLTNIINNLEYKNDIIFKGRFEPAQLHYALASATAIMYVSHFEGFGIPVLEGFNTDTPVITSDVTAMPEIAGEAAICVNPADCNAIADAMTTIVKDKSFRLSLIQKGRERKNNYSWNRSATLMWNSICKILENL